MGLYISIIEIHKSDCKAFFKYINELDPKCTIPCPPTIKDGNTNLTHRSKDIAECLNTFVSAVAANYITSENNTSLNFDKLRHYINSKVPQNTIFEIPQI